MSSLNLLDWLLLLVALVVAVTGWSRGFLVGLLSAIGFVGGAVAGVLLVPEVLGGLRPGLGTAVLAILLVLFVAAVGQGLLAWLGQLARAQLTSMPARRVDAALGSVFAVVGLLVAAWAVGLAVGSSTVPSLATLARESAVLRAVDDWLPVSPEELRRAFRQVVVAGDFPAVVGPFVPEPILEVAPPGPGIARDPEVSAAAQSVVKVTGDAPACNRGQEGSGFVVAPERVVTNAHVLAGVRDPLVLVPGTDRKLPAQVVLFDPTTDVAVLAVPGLDRPPLGFRDDVAAGVDAAVLGYPAGGPLRSGAARVRAELRLRGQDIYGAQEVTREVVSIRGTVRQGNSGGPLVADDGRVYGVIFASSLTDRETGYALAVPEVLPAVAAGTAATDPVSTGGCLP